MKKVIKKLDNKGFTLVELIIVIAIIAVLAAVIAPQYIKYVERSRESTDANAIGEIAHAAQVAAVGDGTATPTDSAMKVVIASDGSAKYQNAAGTEVTAESTATIAGSVYGATAPASYIFKSDLYKGETITITISNGAVSWANSTSKLTNLKPTTSAGGSKT